MQISVSKLIIVPIIVGLIFTMLINGVALIFGGLESASMFVNFYNRTKIEILPFYSSLTMFVVAVLQVVCALLLTASVLKKEFVFTKETNLLKWGLLAGILSVVLYGFMTRMISNHQGAANLFFYTGILYFTLWYVEKRSVDSHPLFEKIKLLPIFFTLFFTMGQPGFNKIFDSAKVIPNYENMFKDSFLAQLPRLFRVLCQ